MATTVSKASKKNAPAIRITLDGHSIRIRTLLPNRITHHGFGSFLENAKKGEISINRIAYVALTRCGYKSGVQGLEVFSGSPQVLAWGAPTPEVIIPLKNVSIHGSRDNWLFKAVIIDEKEPVQERVAHGSVL